MGILAKIRLLYLHLINPITPQYKSLYLMHINKKIVSF